MQKISCTSHDKFKRVRHQVDDNNLIENPMIPFLHNIHVNPEQKFHVHFQGMHDLKVTIGDKPLVYRQCLPIYKFFNEKGMNGGNNFEMPG